MTRTITEPEVQACFLIAAETLAAASRDPTLERFALLLAPMGTWLAIAHDLPEHYAALLNPIQDDMQLRLTIRDAINNAAIARQAAASSPPPA